MQERVRKDGDTAALGQESSPTWLRQLNNLAGALRHPGVTFNKRQVDAFQRAVERVLSPDGLPIRAWFAAREKLFRYHEQPEAVQEYVRGNPNADEIVIYVPGMFDDDSQERMNALYDRSHPDLKADLHKEGWIALNWVYSGRDLRRIHELQLHVMDLMEKHLSRGARVRLFAYSVGGLIAKTVADALDNKYPEQFALIRHHTPDDPTAGFFVRWSNIKNVQKGLEYISEKPHNYRLYSVEGDRDAVVPPGKGFRGKEGQLIRDHTIAGSRHRAPFPTEEAMDGILQILEKAKFKVNRDMQKRAAFAK